MKRLKGRLQSLKGKERTVTTWEEAIVPTVSRLMLGGMDGNFQDQ
jgi:hypothetical protein